MAHVRKTTRTRAPNRTVFKKGHPQYGGRKKGTPNKFTTDMREAILEAFRQLGSERYLVRKGKIDFRTMATLLRAVIPQKITIGPDPDESASKIRDQTRAMDAVTSGKTSQGEKREKET